MFRTAIDMFALDKSHFAIVVVSKCVKRKWYLFYIPSDRFVFMYVKALKIVKFSNVKYYVL